MKKALFQILEDASKASTKNEKIEILRQNDHVALRILLKMTFDEKLRWALPETNPPYKPCQFDGLESALYNEVKRLYIFHEGGHPDLGQPKNTRKREGLFIDILEAIDPGDAKLLLGVKTKKLPYKGITKKLIDEAYPGLLNYD